MSISSSTQDRFDSYKQQAEAFKEATKAKVNEIKADIKDSANIASESLKELLPPEPKYHSTPSNRVRPLKKLPLLSWQYVLNKDYCHTSFFTSKAKFYYDMPHPFTLDGKAVVDIKALDKGARFGSDDQNTWLKFITSVEKYYLESRIWSNKRFRFFLDTPYIDKEKNFKPFITFGADSTIFQWKFSGGVNYLGKRCNAMTRLSTDQQSNIFVDSKAIAREGKFLVSSYLKLNLKELTLPRYDLILGYEDRDFDVYLHHDSQNPQTIDLGALSLNGTYRYQNYILCGQIRTDKLSTNYIFGFHWKVNDDLQLRAKIDDSQNISTALRYRANKNVSFIGGAQLNFGTSSKIVDFSKLLPFPLGFIVELQA